LGGSVATTLWSLSAPRSVFLCCYPEQVGDDTVLREDIALWDVLELTFPYHMHRLIALEGALDDTERSKPQPWVDAAFHKTMALFHHIV
jgi:hypothetical protein